MFNVVRSSLEHEVLVLESLISLCSLRKMGKRIWITPFLRQCFVTAGVSLNMSSHGLVMGFAAILLPQLKRIDSSIQITDSSGSWIAAILGFALVGGNFVVPTVMAKYGRKAANLFSIIPMLMGWICITTAENVTQLLIARVLQGFSMGISSSLGPVLIGEYTSPHNRGMFLTTISVTIAFGVLISHTLGSFLSWQITALIISFIAFIDLLIVIFSPETPSWLSDQGRYEESRTVFRWLRGDGEEDELNRMIDSSVILRESKVEANLSESFVKKLMFNLAYFKSTVRKREFYKPIFIMMHIYTLGQWSGANILAAYGLDIFHEVIGKESNVAYMIITLDIQRIISNLCAVYVIKKVKRRTMLLATVGINVFGYLAVAGYTYGKAQGMLRFDHPYIGVALIHVQMFSIATGTVPLPFIIAGELFPLEYRSLAGGLSVLFLSMNLFITVKTASFLFKSIGLYGAYCLYACVVGYCLVVAGIFLPETKDRTLQDIEDEFRGRPLSTEEMKSMQSLTSVTMNKDRRCSSPVI